MHRKPAEIAAPESSDMRKVYFETLEQIAKPHPSVPLTDWPLFTQMTGGFRLKEFSILCGGTGTGKTTFLANLSAQMLKDNIKHFVMSVETGRHDYMRRILSVLAKRDLNTGDSISQTEIARIHAANQQYLASNAIEFSHYENRVSVEQLMHDVEHMVDTKGCQVAMIDNLNFFMDVTRQADSVVEMDRVVHELIIFCKRVDVHIVMVMHQRKTESGRVENEFDIKGSSTAVQEAQNIFLWNRPPQEDIESGARSPFERELKLNKMRRRGTHVGKTLVFTYGGTAYLEKGFMEWGGGA